MNYLSIVDLFMHDHENLLHNIGNKIRIYRNIHGVSQQELADNADIAKSTVQRIEKGELNPTIILLKKISKAMNIDICNLIS